MEESFVRQALPHAEFMILNECGHFVEIEKPRELATLALEFMRK